MKEGTATSELKVLKLQRCRKAAQFTRACNAAETQITCRANEEELRKRLEALNTALDGVLKINDDYVEKVQEVEEIEEAEEYATRMTARHASTVKAIEDAIKLKSSGCSASETEGKPMSLAPRRDGSIANYVLKETPQEHWNEGWTAPPREPEQIQRSFDMADFLLYDADVDTAKQLKQGAIRALSDGGFKLTKWRSSRHEVLEGTSTSDLASVWVRRRLQRRKHQESSGKRTFSGTRRHVPEKMNPADDCSRGLAASELTSESRWLSGPAFLSDDEENWPAQAPPPPLTDDMEEVKSNTLASVVKDGDQPERLQGADHCRCRRIAATVV
ncbi:hypothetical protein FJT64_008127 [Amphibalanus amphitrite]|uniref:Uncharacterized protein n=1 Tax=Amphibalanus amphitrite TaxID=1232801 RepID=A0A6A4VXM6_AMPAM|nr:hypothetical protein FJT64_008127 [Amphibalanus amphitrite]